jgi:hypothetical protein
LDVEDISRGRSVVTPFHGGHGIADRAARQSGSENVKGFRKHLFVFLLLALDSGYEK